MMKKKLGQMSVAFMAAFVVVVSLGSAAKATLINQWEFDGDFTDSVGGDTGTGNGGAGFGDDRFSNSSSALSVIGSSSQSVSIADGSGLNNLQTGTIALWVQWHDTQDVGFNGVTGAVTSRQWNGNESQQIISLDNTDPGIAKVVWNGYSFGAVITGTTVVGDGTWRHIAVTYTSGEHKLYVDGVLEGTSATVGTMVNNTTTMPFYIGAWAGDGSSYSTSLIDDVRIYDTVLTAGEVAALVPEPCSLLLLLGCCGMAVVRRRRA